VIEDCNARADGRYEIAIQELPPNADDQRTQLARRLAAKDESIDIVALDFVFTAEFAEAEWIRPIPAPVARRVTSGAIPSTVDTGTYEGRLYAAPYTSNTQLLWYRRDRVAEPPKTWAQLIRQAERTDRPGAVQVQGSRAEGFVVWFTSLLYSAGGRVLSEDGEVALARKPTAQALRVMKALATSPAADPSLPVQAEDDNRLAFETGGPTFMVNYPFVFPSAQANAPEVFRNLGVARYPRVDPDRPSSPPLGGLNLAVSRYSEHPEEAFAALECFVSPESQLLATELGGLPPTKASLYDSKVVRDAYPGFADLVLESIRAATPRPQTPAYADLSLAVLAELHPAAGIEVPEDVAALRETIRAALNSTALIG